ncbi:phytanoyl-CoA dioxygenase family protein [Micromonospora sp. NPDC000089]|uniref:phytanoyl-CoA dioxygenase family protein n=1 Tax=unclassified Micromonospora TaxID=2617518 RepID=UPI0036C89143
MPVRLTDDEIREFDENGFLVLRGRIDGPLLDRLQAAADQWIGDGQGAAGDRPRNPDYLYAERPTGPSLFRVDYLHDKANSASLELLGAPALLGIAESLAGPAFVPTYESLVFKQEGDGAPIAWHQDAVHPRRHRIFNIDVYLDHSRRDEGALRVVPGSQRRPADICALTDAYGWDLPGAVAVELEPGDVLVHDVMLVHGSAPVTGNRLRRTLYYEFRAAEQILDEGPWDAEWVRRRLRLVPLGLAEFARRNPGTPGFDWQVPDHLRPESSGDAPTELRIVHESHTPGSYCSAGDVPAAV